MPKGLGLFNELGFEVSSIPSYFESEPTSALDNRTVPMRRLREYFNSEKIKAEILVNSINEKKDKPVSADIAGDE